MSRKKRCTEEHKAKIKRASSLLGDYNRKDVKYNRGKGDLTPKWIVENIFSKPCAYCGKEGWDVIGCNRINNEKSHTKDNVEPCCGECNIKLTNRYTSKIDQTNKDNGEIIETWINAEEISRKLNIDQGGISKCINGKIKTCGGFIWKRHKKE